MPADKPPENTRSGLNENDLLKAIQKSGYPLQTFVSNELSKARFSLHEEWCYVDRETSKLRTIDILGKMQYTARTEKRVRPHLVLLVECKQSDLPYIFFRSLARNRATHFPLLTGLHKYEITVRPQDCRDTYSLSPLMAMRVEDDPFISNAPENCTVFSKVQRKGSNIEVADLKPDDVELSGSKAYTGLVLPLVKSMKHHLAAETPPDTARYFDLSMVMGIGVIDGPMLTYFIENETARLIPAPWVRVFKHEYIEGKHWYKRHQTYAIDLINKDFFSTYLNQHVLPFYEHFKSQALELDEVIAFGNAWTETHSNVFTDGILKAQKE